MKRLKERLKKIIAGFMAIQLVLTFVPVAVPGMSKIANASVGNIVINEILPNAVSTEPDNEWVELYNPGDLPVDVTNWKIDDGEGEYTLSGTIAAGDHMLISGSSYGSTGLQLSNSGEILNLEDDSSNLISSTPNYGSATEGQSYARKPNGSSNWYWDATPTPGTVNNQPPLMPFNSGPGDGTYTASTTVNFTWWSFAPTDPDGDAVNYHLLVDNNGDFLSPEINQPNIWSGNYTAVLPSDSVYYWKVRAFDGYEYSAWSSVWSFTVDTVAPLPPAHISPADGSYVKSAGLVTDWGDVTDPSIPVQYQYQSSESSSTNLDGSFEIPNETSSWSINSQYSPGALSEGTYFWHTAAKDAANNQSAWSVYWNFIVDNTAPVIDATVIDVGPVNVPTSLNGSATDNSGTDINYKWTKISGPGTVNFDSSDIDPAALASADKDGEYTLELTATDKAGNSSAKQIKFTWDSTVNPVKDLYLVTGDGFVDVHWTNPADADFAGVKIFRSTVSGELGTELATVAKTSNSYEDIAILNGTTYYYTVKAVDDLGNVSDPSVQIAATPQAARLALLTTPTSQYDASFEEGQTAQNPTEGEVKSGSSDQKKDEGKGEENQKGKSLPYFGIALLVILALVGVYLLYLQNPEWFGALMFWKKRE